MPSTSPETPVIPLDFDQLIDLFRVDWRVYRSLLRLRGERRHPRMLYIEGNLYLLSHCFAHNLVREKLHSFVTEVACDLDIPFTFAGSTTLYLQDKEAGADPDDSFYFAQCHRIRGNKEVTLPDDPPPDLVLEVVETEHDEILLDIYSRFGVPEVWIWENSALCIFTLKPDGSYARHPRSLVLADLPASEISSWINRPFGDLAMTGWMRDLRRWAEEDLEPRLRNPQQPR